ncbi:MAG: restriction endonuclease subunit S, partial [Atopostipes suicloacalis]|nr:restriction endonuclease subunit S [Atopostipes suicloacalis]
IKSAYLSEMFPKEGEKYPKMRFEGFTEQWEEKKLNEISNYHTSSVSSKDVKEIGKYKLYDANELIGYISNERLNQKYITIIKDGSGVGRVRLLEKDSYFIGTMGAISALEMTNIYYLYAYLEKFNFTDYIIGATIPHVYYSDYGNSVDYHPGLKEQKKIGSFFKKLDDQIELEEEKLAKLEKVKEAYLDDLFV